MWFGTSGGLNRFDGYEFRTYTHEPQYPNSLSNNTVRGLLEDRDGGLWIATRDGLNRFDPVTETFEIYRHEDTLNQNWNDLDAIYEDDDGGLWLGSWGGLSRFDAASGRFTNFSLPATDSEHPQRAAVKAIFEDRFGVLWIGTRRRGLLQFDRNSGAFKHLEQPDLQGHAGVEIWRIYEDRAGDLWVCSNDVGLSLLDRDRRRFRQFSYEGAPYPIVERGILDIVEDRSGQFWLASLSLLQFDRATRTFVAPRNELDRHNRPGAMDLISLYKDNEGALWMGSLGGIYRLDQTPIRAFKNIRTAKPVTAVWEDTHSYLWLGDAEGLTRYDEQGLLVAHYHHVPGDSGSLGNGNVYTIFQDHIGDLWVSTAGYGVSRFNKRTETFKYFRSELRNPNSLSNNWVRYLLEDRLGALWAGTDSGLSRFHRQSDTFRRYQHGSDEFANLSRSYIYAMCEDRFGDLWIGATDGLYRLRPATDTFHAYRHDARNPTSLSHDSITTILEDRSGVIWIGTNGGGLNKFERAGESFVRFKQEDGLAHNAVCGILADDQSRLWISTSNGLSRFTPQTRTFKNYDISDGLVGNAFSKTAYHRSRKSGRMFFGGLNGLTSFHPDSIKDNPYVPPVVITHFERHSPGVAFDSVIVHKGISQKERLRLSQDDMIFTIKFAALSYRNPDKNRYAYKLEGVKDRWIALGTNREVTFTNLAPGDYTLQVKGSNNDGVWNEQGAALAITVTPPWWQTWWMYSVCVIGFVVLLYGLRRYELNRQQYKHRVQLQKVESERIKELDHLKSRFFDNISHEFRTPLTLILGQVERVLQSPDREKDTGRLQAALSNAKRLLSLINQLLDISKLEAGKMKLSASKQDLIQHLRPLVASFESLAEQQKVTLQFITKHQQLALYFDPEKVDRILINLLSNALKFTDAGGGITVEVGLIAHGRLIPMPTAPNRGLWQKTRTEITEFVEITVRDTGIGIPSDRLLNIFDRFYQVDLRQTREREGTGIGLALVKELTELHHGTISASSQRGKGSAFVVRLPLGQEHLQPDEIAAEPTRASAEPPPLRQPPAKNIEMTMPSDPPKESPEGLPTGTGEVILVVEDNLDVRRFVCEHLQDNYRVLEAGNGEEGLARAQKEIPDLVITDIMMPEMTGYQLVDALRKDERTSHIAIVILTARADDDARIDGLEAGADAYLTKPFNAKELQVRIRKLIEVRRQLRDRFSKATVIKPSEVTAVSVDQAFLQRLVDTVEAHFEDSGLAASELAASAHMSVSQLNRKLNALIGQPAGKFIRSLRLQRAADLLSRNAGTVAEISYQVGFDDPAHFARRFREQFGCAPSEMRANSNQVE